MLQQRRGRIHSVVRDEESQRRGTRQTWGRTQLVSSPGIVVRENEQGHNASSVLPSFSHSDLGTSRRAPPVPFWLTRSCSGAGPSPAASASLSCGFGVRSCEKWRVFLGAVGFHALRDGKQHLPRKHGEQS
jgi:hypothetical protein